MRPILPGLLLCLSVVIVSGATLQAQVQPRGTDSTIVNPRTAEPSPQVVRHAESLNTRLQPNAKIWILDQPRAEAHRPAPDLDSLDVIIRQHLTGSLANSPNPGGSAQPDVDALTFMVMMQATADNEGDLKSQMASLQAIATQKGAERKLLDDLNAELAKGNQRNLACTALVCRSLSSRVEFINQANSDLGRPSRFEASQNMTDQQLASLQIQLSHNLQTMNELSDMTSMRMQMTMDRRSKFIRALSTIEKKISGASSAIVQNMK